MSCWNRTTTNLRSGTLYSYNTNLGDPKNLTTDTHYSTNSYSTRNQNMIKGIAEYERIVSHIESYTGKLDFCPRVDDLAATYNALNEELGISGRVLNKAEFLKLADQRDSMLPKQPQGKSAIRGKKAASMKIHQLRGRGVDGGRVFVDVESIRQRIENEKRIKEEERVQAQLNLEIEAIKAESARLEQIRINQQKQKEHDEKIRLEKIEQQRLQKIANDEEIRIAKELEEKVRQDEIKREESAKLKLAIIPETIPEITPELVATSSLLPLGIIALFLYSRTGKN